MALGVIVVEAKFRSGSTITARYAKEQNKNVYCLPSNLGVKNGVGTNTLIAKGSKILLSENQILEELNIKVKSINNSKSKPIKKEYKEIYKTLTNMPKNINEIIRESKILSSEVFQLLTIMELEGLIKSLPGNKYVKE